MMATIVPYFRRHNDATYSCARSSVTRIKSSVKTTLLAAKSVAVLIQGCSYFRMVFAQALAGCGRGDELARWSPEGVPDFYFLHCNYIFCMMGGAFLAVFARSRLVVCTVPVTLLHMACYHINEDCQLAMLLLHWQTETLPMMTRHVNSIIRLI